MLTDAEARAAVSSLSWVFHSPKGWARGCDAIRFAGREEYAAADPYSRDEIRAKHRCRRRANWVFIGLDGRIRVLCWPHLWWAGLHGSEAERLRFRAAADRYDWSHYSPELDPEDSEFPGVDSPADGA